MLGYLDQGPVLRWMFYLPNAVETGRIKGFLAIKLLRYFVWAVHDVAGRSNIAGNMVKIHLFKL